MKILATLLLFISFPAFAQFHHQYRTPDYDWARSIDAVGNEGYIIAGATLDPGISWRPVLLRADEKGNFKWAYLFPLQGNDEHFMDVRTAGWLHDDAFGAVGSADFAPGGLGGTDIYYLFVDDAAAPVQARRFGTSGTDVGRHLHDVLHPSYGPGFVITGYTFDPATGTGKDIVVLFVNYFGNIAAGHIFRVAEDQDPYWIESTGEGGFIVTGRLTQADSIEPGKDAVFLLKLDKFLNMEWFYSYDLFDGDDPTDDYAYAVKQVESGNFIVAGTRRKHGAALSYAPFLLKTNKLGKTIYARDYSVTGWSAAEGLSLASAVDANGDWEYVISGRTHNSFDALAFKTDYKGDPVWGMTYPDANTASKADYIIRNNVGGYAMTGLYFDLYSGSSYDAHLIEIDSAGRGAASCTNEVRVNSREIKFFQRNKKYSWLDRVQQVTVSTSRQAIPFTDTWCP